MAMSVLERGNLQLLVKNIVYHLRKLGKPASRKIYFFFRQKFNFLEAQSCLFNFRLHDKHDLHEIAMN